MATIGAWGRGPAGQPPLGPGVLAGGQLMIIQQGGSPDRFVMAYPFPEGSGNFITWEFSDRAQVDAFFGQGWSSRLPITYHSQGWYDQKATVAGNAAEVKGLEGGWTNFVNEAIKEGMELAGVDDPTILGQMLANPEMRNLMAQAYLGDWNDDQIRAEQRQTNFWKTQLYPGIEKFYGMTSEPERAWQNYAQTMESALVSLGYARDADGSFKSRVGQALNAGIEASTFTAAAPIFLRASQSQDYFNQLQSWVQHDLGKTITFGDWFGVLAGEAEPDISQVAERATLAYLAEQSGTVIDQAGIMRLSNEADMSEAQAKAAYAEMDQALGALGARGLAKYGLARDDIFALKTGIAPLSGRSHEEIRLKSLQAIREEGLLDDKKIDLFVGYDQLRGNPNRPGLNMLAPTRE